MLPFASLYRTTEIGPGASKDLEKTAAYHSMVVTTTGSVERIVVDLEGSLDHGLWIPIATFESRGNGGYVLSQGACVVRYVRAYLVDMVPRYNPTVTAMVASY